MIRPGLFLCGVAAMVASACAPAPAEMTDVERAAVETSARSAFEGIVAAIASADQDGLMGYVADGSIFAFHGMVWDRAGLASTLGDFYGSIARSDMENFAPLQFDVLKFRMQAEYNVELKFSPIDLKVARWPKGKWDPSDLGHLGSTKLLEDREGHPVLLFDNQHTMRWIQQRHPGLELAETAD